MWLFIHASNLLPSLPFPLPYMYAEKANWLPLGCLMHFVDIESVLCMCQKNRYKKMAIIHCMNQINDK